MGSIIIIIFVIICIVCVIADKISEIIREREELRRLRCEEYTFSKENRELRQKIDSYRDTNACLSTELQKYKDNEIAFSPLIRELRHELDVCKNTNARLSAELQNHKDNEKNILSSNLVSMPWLAGMMADYLTYDLEVEAQKLDWGKNIQREKKVASIRQLRAEAKATIEEAKIAAYQLEYLKTLFPVIDEIIETEYADLHVRTTIPEGDSTRQYLSSEEWQALSVSERNQLALDRYISSHRKTKWQIGRDYENAVSYEYRQKGYTVDNCGSYLGLSDMGRDIIAKKDGVTIIIQCKYWSKEKTIHEKHIFQLYGTLVSYCIEHSLPFDSVHGVFVTNTTLSDVAKNVAQFLGIRIAEHHPMTEYPRIKCNIGHDEEGHPIRIYHLPMDDQYDSTKIDSPGEFYAFTVEEAESNGFRRAYRWHGIET